MKAINFQDTVAISTGAASGMGLLFAENFAELCGNVVMCDVNEEILSEKVAAVNAKGGGRAIGVVLDVRDYSQVCSARDKAVAEPQKIVDPCLFIASDKGQFINGENIMIDGGRNAMRREQYE